LFNSADGSPIISLGGVHVRRLLTLPTAILVFTLNVAVATPGRLGQELAACRVGAQSVPPRVAVAPPGDDAESEKYAVYSALIRDLYVRDETRLLVIAQQTTCLKQPADEKIKKGQREFEEGILRRLPELKREVMEDFSARESECYSLGRRLDIPVEYVLLTSKDFGQVFPQNITDPDAAWRRFYEKYPGASGSISLSNIGLSREADQAVVITGIGCGSLCGQGYCVFLTKEKGTWKVKSKIPTWVS
jgi:hypothetical protein